MMTDWMMEEREIGEYMAEQEDEQRLEIGKGPERNIKRWMEEG